MSSHPQHHVGSTTPSAKDLEPVSALKACAAICNACADTCLATVTRCLARGGVHADPEHIRLLLDCIDICRTSAAFMNRCSPFHALTCDVCAELCERCADSCERLAFTSREMRSCTEACHLCAATCRRMGA